MHSAAPFLRDTESHREEFTRGWTMRPEKAAIGIGAAISGALIFIRTKREESEAGGDCSVGSILWERLPILLILVLAFRFQDSVAEVLKQSTTLGCRWARMALRRSAISSTNLRNSFSSSDALSRLSRVSSSVSSRICNTLKSYRARTALKAITRKECFAKVEYIKRLSIHDMVILFRYASDVNQADFHKKKFMVEQSKLVRSMVTAMDMAVTMSRGAQRQSAKTKNDGRKGDIDALYFTAVTRIFAEWRTLRLIPRGYGRYAAGLSMAYRDVLQNLAKIEAGVHFYLKHFGEKSQSGVSLCPTLGEVIEFERVMGVHSKLPYLNEKSAASGLLWTKRQLDYQTTIFFNTLHVPAAFATTEAAANAAYLQVFGEYHGWALRQLFSQSFGGSPPLEAIFKQMNPGILDDNSSMSYGIHGDVVLSDVSENGELLDNELLAAMDGFGRLIGKKWDDVLRFFNCVDNKNRGDRSQNVFVSRESYLDMNNVNSGEHMDTLSECVSDDSNESPIPCDPHEHMKLGIIQFANDLRPLLEDISGLLEENNMNDPTRV